MLATATPRVYQFKRIELGARARAYEFKCILAKFFAALARALPEVALYSDRDLTGQLSLGRFARRAVTCSLPDADIVGWVDGWGSDPYRAFATVCVRLRQHRLDKGESGEYMRADSGDRYLHA
jgi:hypothetical protein